MQEFWWYGANTRGKGHNAASTEAGQGALTSAALRRRLRSIDPKIPAGRPGREGGSAVTALICVEILWG
jgi:hypothetical protein